MTLDTDNAKPAFILDEETMKLFADSIEAAGLPRDIEFHAVNSESGNIAACSYYPETRQMLVTFKGKSPTASLYLVDNVEPEVYGGFAMTFPDRESSTGAYYNAMFRKQSALYPSRRIA